MNLVNKILKESEEDNLFKPRRLKGRKDKEKEKLEKLQKQYPIGSIVDVYLAPDFNENNKPIYKVLIKNKYRYGIQVIKRQTIRVNRKPQRIKRKNPSARSKRGSRYKNPEHLTFAHDDLLHGLFAGFRNNYFQAVHSRCQVIYLDIIISNAFPLFQYSAGHIR